MLEKHILVIDDDPSFCLAISNMLKAAGYKVKCVGDGRAALTAIRTDRPDLALVDIGLPGLDGCQLIALTKRDSTLGKTPLVVVTGRNIEEEWETARKFGADAILPKPIDRAELIRIIGELLSARPEPDSNAEPNKTKSDQSKKDSGWPPTNVPEKR